MRVLLISKVTKTIDDQTLPLKVGDNAADFEAMGKYIEALTQAGVLVMAEGLKPSRYAKRVRFDGAKRATTDGPFTETKELIASYSIWEVQSMEEALEWVKKSPNPMNGTTEIEIRPVLGAEDFDFGGAMPAEEKAGWEKMTGREQ